MHATFNTFVDASQGFNVVLKAVTKHRDRGFEDSGYQAMLVYKLASPNVDDVLLTGDKAVGLGCSILREQALELLHHATAEALAKRYGDGDESVTEE